MAKIISSQRYLDDDLVQAKRAAKDYVVHISPLITVDGADYRVVQDGHHSLEAAKLDGASPVYVEQTATDNDRIGLIREDGLEDDFLSASYVDSDWYDVSTGIIIW